MNKTCRTGECNQGRNCVAEVVQFQKRGDLHRYFAPGAVEGYRAPMTKFERVLLVLIFFASVFVVFSLIGWGYQELKQYDWSALAGVVWKN